MTAIGVNAIIGDQSYVEKHGVQPEGVPEKERIQTHLSFVEELLRQSTVDHLTLAQRENREKVIDILNGYWQQGEFPSDFEHDDARRPCFIDRRGTLCALGFLMKETEGLETAQAVNDGHQFAYVSEMSLPALALWADRYGLSRRECAMVQPTYTPTPFPGC